MKDGIENLIKKIKLLNLDFYVKVFLVCWIMFIYIISMIYNRE